MNDIVLSLDQIERERLGKLVDHFMVGERDVLKMCLDEAYDRHIIQPNKRDPYEEAADVEARLDAD